MTKEQRLPIGVKKEFDGLVEKIKNSSGKIRECQIKKFKDKCKDFKSRGYNVSGYENIYKVGSFTKSLIEKAKENDLERCGLGGWSSSYI